MKQTYAHSSLRTFKLKNKKEGIHKERHKLKTKGLDCDESCIGNEHWRNGDGRGREKRGR